MTFGEIIISLEIGLIYGIIAAAIYLTFRIIDFPDLTCDGSFVLGSAISASLITLGFNPWAALLISVFGGILSGFITGLLNTKFKISNLLSGILVAFMLYSINLHVMGGIPNIAFIASNTIFTSYNYVTIILLIAFFIILALSYLLITDFGLAIRAVGQNKRFAQNGGVNIEKMTIICLGISNGLVAMGGAIFGQYQGFSDISSGVGTVIVGLASVIIGERILPYRSILIQITSCFIGSILYRFIISIALHLEIFGLKTIDLNLITGLIVIFVMLIPRDGNVKT